MTWPWSLAGSVGRHKEGHALTESTGSEPIVFPGVGGWSPEVAETKGLGRLAMSDWMRPSERLDEAAGGDRGREAG